MVMTGHLSPPSLTTALSFISETSLLRLLLLAFSLFSLPAPYAFAQEVLDFGILPACAGACPSLTDAQASCVPPAAPATDQTTYESCFCQSAFLQPLFTSPNGVCDAFCAQPELDRIWQWFTGLCQNGVEPIDEEGNTDGDDAAEDPPPVVSNPAQPSPTPVLSDNDDDGEDGSWVSNHWEWIVFLVVLILGIIFFSILGVWLKRRYRRKRDLAGVNLAAPEAVAPETREIHTSQSTMLSAATPAAVGAGSSRTRTRKRTLSLGTGPGVTGAGAGASSMTSRDSTIIMPDMSSQLHLPVPAPSKGAWSVSSRPNSRPQSRVWTPDSGVGSAGALRTHSRAGSSSMILERMGDVGEGERSNRGRRSSTPSGAAALAESNVITENADERPSSAGIIGNGNGRARERADGAGAGAGNMRHGGSKLRE